MKEFIIGIVLGVYLGFSYFAIINISKRESDKEERGE